VATKNLPPFVGSFCGRLFTACVPIALGFAVTLAISAARLGVAQEADLIGKARAQDAGLCRRLDRDVHLHVVSEKALIFADHEADRVVDVGRVVPGRDEGCVVERRVDDQLGSGW
jgi:hypothetical protein